MPGTAPHPCFDEAIRLHQASHTMREADYLQAMGDLLDNDTGCLAAGLRGLLIGMHSTPACLVHAVFLAGVLYGRDVAARTPTIVSPDV